MHLTTKHNSHRIAKVISSLTFSKIGEYMVDKISATVPVTIYKSFCILAKIHQQAVQYG